MRSAADIDVAKAGGSRRDGPAATSPVKSATRVLDLFEFLARWGAVQSHAQIAEELGIPKSSLTHLLKTLVQRGYLRYVPEEKGYQLGSSIAALAVRASDGDELRAAAAIALDFISEETGESCALNVLKGDKSEVVACVMSVRQRLAIHMSKGDTAPLHATSGGKALLAFMPPEAISDYVARVRFQKITPNTIGTAEELLAQLEDVRRTGIAHVYEEFTPGIAGIACPILSATGYPLGSINIAVPVLRYGEAERASFEHVLLRARRLLLQRLSLEA